MSLFLSIDDVARLTGYKRKGKQCEQLAAMHIPYRLNAAGEPIVSIAFINGAKEEKQTKAWQPAILQRAA